MPTSLTYDRFQQWINGQRKLFSVVIRISLIFIANNTIRLQHFHQVRLQRFVFIVFNEYQPTFKIIWFKARNNVWCNVWNHVWHIVNFHTVFFTEYHFLCTVIFNILYTFLIFLRVHFIWTINWMLEQRESRSRKNMSRSVVTFANLYFKAE